MLAAEEGANQRRGRHKGAPRGGGHSRKAAGGGWLLVRPRESWPPWSGGMSMELYHQPEDATKGNEGELHGSWFVFTYSSAYRHSERELQAAVETADPGQLQRVLQQWPYQVDALLRLSDYTMRTGQHELSSELIEKALFAFQSALHPMCKLAHGRARLSYAHKPNQIFFHTLFRHMVNLGRRRAPSHSPAFSRASVHLSPSLPNIAHRRGCPRTAFETARLLLSLEPSSDPTHVLLHIDYYALTAGDPSFVLKLPRMLPSHSLLLYPNQAYSFALASKQSGEVDSDERLEQALLLFPAVFPLLLPRIAPTTASQESDQLVHPKPCLPSR
ncbi:MAG: hypothetical protein SGPRY_004746 [Prymnesium sp.]